MGYAWYRLRFFLASYLVESAAHGVLAVVALRTLGPDDVELVIAAHGAVLLVSYFWWGALEALRAQVRDVHRVSPAAPGSRAWSPRGSGSGCC